MDCAKYMKDYKFKLNDHIIIMVVFVLYAMIVLRDAGIIDMNPMIIVVICATSFVFFSINNTTKILVFLLPFASGILYNIIVLVAFVVIFIKSLFDQKISISLILCIFVGIFIGLYNVILELPNDIINDSFKLGTYICTATLLVFKSNELKVESILKYFVIGTLLSFVSVIYITFSTYSLDYIMTYGIRVGHISDSISVVTSYDSNAMGMFSILTIALVYLLNRSKHMSNLYSSFLIISSAIMGATSISRTYFLLCTLLLIYIVVKNNSKKKIINLLGGAAILFVLYMVIMRDSSFYNYVIQQYGNRFLDSNVGSLGNRSSIFNDYMSIYLKSIKHVLFGAGITGYKALNNGLSTHNGFQEVFLAWGLTGVIIIVTWVAALINEVSKDREKKLGLELYIPLIFFTIYIQTLQWFSIYTYIILTAVSLIAIRIKFKRG